MDWVVGIDPGLYGAVAFYHPRKKDLIVFDMSIDVAAKSGKRMVNAVQLAKIFDDFMLHQEIEHAFIEQVGAMPGQGVVSMFNFGVSCGIVAGVVAANNIPTTMVVPGKWKKAMGVPAKKDAAMLRASQLLPRHSGQWVLKKHDGRAEAALIALYGSQQLQSKGSEDHEPKHSRPEIDILS